MENWCFERVFIRFKDFFLADLFDFWIKIWRFFQRILVELLFEIEFENLQIGRKAYREILNQFSYLII
jgi:hypothetical protein